MRRMEVALRDAGFITCNIDYPSTHHRIETLVAEHLLPRLRDCAGPDPGEPLHFVTHSMGGILVRQLALSHPGFRFGRVVMLGPPNQGSELVDRLRDIALFRWINGPAGRQLGTDAASLPNRLGPARFELGVIAGDHPVFEPFTGFIANASDGKVSVASARLDGMRDFVVLPVTHALMMRDPEVISHAIRFLKTGSFRPGGATVSPESHCRAPSSGPFDRASLAKSGARGQHLPAPSSPAADDVGPTDGIPR